MQKLFSAIRKGMDTVVPPISGVLFLVGVSVTFYGVIVRSLRLPFPTYWVEEVTRYTLIWGSLLLMGICFRKKIQTQLTLLEERLTGRTKAGHSLIVNIFLAVLFGIMVVGGIYLVALNVKQRTAGLMVSMSIPYLAIPLSSILVEIELLMMIVEDIVAMVNKTPPEDISTVKEV